MLIYWELNEWNEQHGQNKTFSNSLCGKSPLLVPFSIIIKFDKKSHPSLNECIEQRIRYKLRDMDGEKVQICMYRTYRGIIIISDYNSCNISYTIVDKYFLSLLHAVCFMLYVSVCPISIKFHFMLILLCMEYWRLLHRHLLLFSLACLPFTSIHLLSCNSTGIIVHEVNLRRKRNEEGKKITFINLYFVSIDRNCQIHKKFHFHLCWYECP